MLSISIQIILNKTLISWKHAMQLHLTNIPPIHSCMFSSQMSARLGRVINVVFMLHWFYLSILLKFVHGAAHYYTRAEQPCLCRSSLFSACRSVCAGESACEYFVSINTSSQTNILCMLNQLGIVVLDVGRLQILTRGKRHILQSKSCWSAEDASAQHGKYQMRSVEEYDSHSIWKCHGKTLLMKVPSYHLSQLMLPSNLDAVVEGNH